VGHSGGTTQLQTDVSSGIMIHDIEPFKGRKHSELKDKLMICKLCEGGMATMVYHIVMVK
jgi:hypothetical protein